MEKKRNEIAGLCLLLAMGLVLLWSVVYYVPEGETVVYLEQTRFGPFVHEASGPEIIPAFKGFMPNLLIRGKFEENLTSRIEVDRKANGSTGRHYSGEATYRIMPDRPQQFYGLYNLYEESKDLEAASDKLVKSFFAQWLSVLPDKGINCTAGCEKSYLEKDAMEFIDPKLEDYGIHLQNVSVYPFPAWPVNSTAEN
jgi:hypothetical protein